MKNFLIAGLILLLTACAEKNNSPKEKSNIKPVGKLTKADAG